jgi:hypothetical protein
MFGVEWFRSDQSGSRQELLGWCRIGQSGVGASPAQELASRNIASWIHPDYPGPAAPDRSDAIRSYPRSLRADDDGIEGGSPLQVLRFVCSPHEANAGVAAGSVD